MTLPADPRPCQPNERKRVVMAMYAEGYPLNEIAAATGLTRGGVKATVAYLRLRRAHTPAAQPSTPSKLRVPYAGYDPTEPRWGTPSCIRDGARGE